MSEIYSTAADRAKQAVREVLCAAGGTQRVAIDVASKLNPRYKGSQLADFFERQNKALRSFCPLPPTEDVPDLTPGFSGGQCEDEAYTVVYQGFANGQPTTGELTTAGLGPIGIKDVPATNPDGSTSDNGQRFMTSKNPSGGVFETLLGSYSPTSGPQILSVTRNDGEPDDCGDPPPKPLPPDAPPPTDPRPQFPDVTINLPDIGPVVVAFAPVVGIIYADVDARIKIPVKVNVNIPAINFNFDIDFNIDLNDPDASPEPIPTEPEGDSDDRPVEPDCPLPPACDEEPEENPEGEADEDKRDAKGAEVVAATVLAVRNSDSTRATEIVQATAPNIQAPALGFINFVYETPEGEVLYSSDLPVKNVRTVIPAPDVGYECVRVVGTPNQGFDWELFEVTGIRNRGGSCGS